MIKIKGSIPAKTLAIIKSKGMKGTPGVGCSDIPMDTENFYGNRTPKAKVLSDYLKNGFDWGLYGAPLVAKLPDGTLKIYDGGHRVAMLQIEDPTRKTFPGVIIDVEDTKQIARMFHRVNGSAASFVNPETRFINEVLGEEEGIEKYISVLEKSKVTVYEAEDNFVPKTVHPKWKINVKPMQDMVNDCPFATVWSLNLYTTAWGQFDKYSTELGTAITGQIVKGLFTIKKCNVDNFFNIPTNEKRFMDWFVRNVGDNPSKSDWLFNVEYKHDRMESRHYGTALGIWTKFCSYARNQPWRAEAPSVKGSLIERLYKDYDDKRSAKTNNQKTSTITASSFTGNTYDELVEELA